MKRKKEEADGNGTTGRTSIITKRGNTKHTHHTRAANTLQGRKKCKRKAQSRRREKGQKK
jgi:hypothetical protein